MSDAVLPSKSAVWNEICDQMNMMFVSTDEHLRIRDASPKLAAYAGYSLEGLALTEAFPTLLGVEEELRRIVRGEASIWRIPSFPLIENEPSAIYDLLFLSPEEEPGLVMVARRMEIEKAIEQELRQQRNEMALLKEKLEAQTAVLEVTQERLESLKRQRSSLVDIITHDIRSALSITQGYVEWLRDSLSDSASPQQMQALETIGQETERIAELVREVQAFQRAEQALETMQRQSVNLVALLNAVTSMWRDVARVQNVSLETKVKGPIPSIKGDPELLQEAFNRIYAHLLSEAAPPATLQVEIDAWPGWVLVRFTCDKVKRIGVMATGQGRGALTDRERKAQLRLARSRIIAEGHGGHLSLNEEGADCAILFWLPAETAPIDEAAQAKAMTLPFRPPKRRIEREESAGHWLTVAGGAVRIDTVREQVWLNNKRLKLTETEYRLLRYLAEHADEVASTNDLQVYLGKEGHPISLSSLRVLIWRLRQHLGGEEGAGRHLRTVRGFGYLLSS